MGGKIVKTRSGHIGRTYSKQCRINGKVRVYKAAPGQEDIEPSELKFNQAGSLIRSEELTVIGFID